MKPADPPLHATPESVLENMFTTKCQHIFIVPSFLEVKKLFIYLTRIIYLNAYFSKTWARDPKALAMLKALPNLYIVSAVMLAAFT
jgi:hypothetical protein